MFGYSERPNFPVRYNIAPTQPIAIVIGSDGHGSSESHDGTPGASPAFKLARWGLWPSWVKDTKDFPTLINARSEQAAEKPAFRAAMRRRRCLIPANGFYEWQGSTRGKKQPHLIRPAQGSLFAFAGVWETYMDKTGSEIDTAAILTTAANDYLTPLHHRMPVVIQPDQFDRWLDCDGQSPSDVSDLLVSAPEEFFVAYPVSTRVNAVANDDEGLLAPLAETDTPPVTEAKTKPKRAKKQQASTDQFSLFDPE